MRDTRPFSALHSSNESWLNRVCGNVHQLLASVRILPTSANGAPIHLLRWEKSPRTGRALSFSVFTHVAIIGALVLAAAHGPGSRPHLVLPGDKTSPAIPLSSTLLDLLRGRNANGGNGSGTGHDLLPPNQGNLPPRSSIQLLKPTLPQNQKPEVPVPPTILDPSAPRVLTAVENIGLPWMPDRNNSSGRGKGNTIGEGPNDSIGSSPGDQTGVSGPPGVYQPGVTLPKCAYCPDPQYTDEAREAKLQGRVTLQVQVGADGRAAQIRVVQGIGLGLDERAIQAIRSWKFIPAHDPAHHTVPAWVTVEAVFRLF